VGLYRLESGHRLLLRRDIVHCDSAIGLCGELIVEEKSDERRHWSAAMCL
jgi:hypothetical protein